jgi:integrase
LLFAALLYHKLALEGYGWTVPRRKTSAYLADVVTLALETGMRKGELLSLMWDRVDLSRG